MAAKLPPGSVKLVGTSDNRIILHPKPTDDYDDPLNWSSRRKVLHMGVVVVFVSVTFWFLGTPQVVTVQLRDDLGMDSDDIALSFVFNFIGLGLAGVGLIPLAYRYGRRSMYLISALIQIGASIWLGSVTTKYEYFVCMLIAGMGASVTQTLVPMTIADMFFVHQFATMNGWYLFAQGTGAFLGPAISGKVVKTAGWRWVWWTHGVVLSVAFIGILFLLEESTFVPNDREDKKNKADGEELFFFNRPVSYGSNDGAANNHVDLVDINRTMAMRVPELPPLPKTLRQRFALITKTKRPIGKRFLAPFVILVTFPAVAYVALTYGAVMAWLAMFQHVAVTVLGKAPYNFDSEGIGLFSLAPFIGHTIGVVVVPMLSDRWMLRLARQNGGIYHPEMRLRIAVPGAIFTFIGILMFGLSTAKRAPWPALAISFAVFAFGFGICLDVALAYISDCYYNMIGDALVGVIFVRNLIALGVTFGAIPWIDNMGMRNTFILTAATAAVVLMLPGLLMVWGKKARAATAAKYEHYSLAAIPPAAVKRLMAADTHFS